jgi:hypothetical protein
MKLTGIVNSTNENTVIVSFIVGISTIIVAVVAAVAMYNIEDRNNMSKNMEQAISKGVDPLSVKCAYETNTSQTCTILALGKK